MGKVFRLHAGNDTIADWDNSTAYGATAINQITDPNGATSKKEITSIPSPFARMDLMKSAFKQVVDSGMLEGDTIHHKMVSDCFDVGEIFFNIDKLKDKIQILVWDKDNDFNALLNSSNPKHRLLGETLRIYFDQDAATYNFDKLERLYLLNYIGPDRPSPMNIIGATSPATLFFTSANKLDYVARNIQFGNDRPFDDDYQPLFKRQFHFQKYWYCLKHIIPQFVSLFPEVDSYLSLNYRYLSEAQKDEISALTANSISDYTPLTVSTANNNVEIFGYILYKKKPGGVIHSDFEIASVVDLSGCVKPLVLSVDIFIKKIRYTQDYWDKNTVVPCDNPLPLNQRTLPGDGFLYPYLTIGDFLQDTIIRVPYRMNKSRYFDGNDLSEGATDSYLIPLKRTYFDYFTVNELKGYVGGKRTIEMERISGGSIKVVLRIPIQNDEFITYERLYYKDGIPNIEQNKGSVVDFNFGFAMLASIKFDIDALAQYRLMLLDQDSTIPTTNNHYDISCYNESVSVAVKDRGRRIEKNDYFVTASSYLLDANFNQIEIVVNGKYKGLVVPRFEDQAGNREFTFAIDFGTTNTHIEYSVGNGESLAFDISDKDIQLQKLHLDYPDTINGIFNADFIPDVVGLDSVKKTDYFFPIRTILSEGDKCNWLRPMFSLVHVNIPFSYEKKVLPDYNKLTTDLKWSNEDVNQKRIYLYLDTLFLLMRNKVLLNKGSLEKTKITWFYPASMTEKKFNDFKEIWEKLYQANFGNKLENLIAMSESVAPYYYYQKKKGAVSNVVSIDIGGGTTDVVIVEDGAPKYLTSFRFAANAIFGDGYAFDADNNGFVQYFESEIEKRLVDNKLDDLISILKRLDSNKVSADIVAFFFSLANNQEARKGDIDFNKLLSNDQQGKIVFVLFYAALIYHIAKIMKAKGLKEPRHIAFSGTGSKILQVLTNDDRTLSKYTKIIFEKVYGMVYNDDGLDIIRDAQKPKQATCKGGILKNEVQYYDDISDMKATLLGTNDSIFVAPGMKYEDITETKIESVVQEVRAFIKLVFDMNEEFSYANKFGSSVNVLDKAKSICGRDMELYLKSGIKKKMEEISKSGAESKIEESLFFYPLVGVLNALARELYK